MFECECVTHFVLRFHHYTNIRITLENRLNQIDNKILCVTENNIVKLLLFDDQK